MTQDAVRLAVALAMLLGASVADLRTRRVPNRYWALFALAAACFVLADLRSEPLARLRWTYGLALALALAFYAFWRIGLFGGADAKGLMLLAFLVPGDPPHQLLVAPYTLAALLNGSLLLLALPVLFLAVNALRGDLRLPAALLGLRLDTGRARRLHVWPLERVDDSGKPQWQYWQHIARSLDEEYDLLERAGVQRVWVTPKLPFMVAILAGLALAPWTGNLVLRAMEALAA